MLAMLSFVEPNVTYLCNLFDIYDILGIIRPRIYNLSAAGNLPTKYLHVPWSYFMTDNRSCFWNMFQAPWPKITFNIDRVLQFHHYGVHTLKLTCKGCSSCIICLSETRSHWLGAARPVSDSLMPVKNINIYEHSTSCLKNQFTNVKNLYILLWERVQHIRKQKTLLLL